jgi:phytoene dehydrogenase-like protein
LAAAIEVARAGRSIVVFEQSGHAGGGLRSEYLTLPGFLHDVCSSVYPLGVASPFFESIPLVARGAEWVHPPLPVAHPLDGGEAVMLERSIDRTAAELGDDGASYRRLFEPLAREWRALVEDVLAPVHVPRHPFLLARFGVSAIQSAVAVANGRFKGIRARALFAGLAAHSTLRLDASLSAAAGVLLGTLAHAVGWPFVSGGAARLAAALVAELQALGGTVVTNRTVSSIDELAPARAVICDVTPRQLAAMAGSRLLPAPRSKFERYRYGPGVFKLDWALSDPIPWRAGACREAGTVHVGGTLDDIARAERAPWSGTVAERPFVLVTQPGTADRNRAPGGRHTAWGYCHVPHGSGVDATERIEAQIERFAPGFRDTILERHAAGPAGLQALNPNLVGGDIGGGTLDLRQFVTRPTWRGYRTGAPGLYICSSSTPPGGGVHGMCGYHAAQAVLRDLR